VRILNGAPPPPDLSILAPATTKEVYPGGVQFYTALHVMKCTKSLLLKENYIYPEKI
jgi:hypothetical protein